VSHFAQAQGTGQARASLEGVQRAQHLGAGAAVIGPGHPLAQGATEHGQQFLRLVGKDREQVGIDRVERVDVIVDVLHRHGWQRRHGRKDGHAVAVGGGVEIGRRKGRWHLVGTDRARHRCWHVSGHAPLGVEHDVESRLGRRRLGGERLLRWHRRGLVSLVRRDQTDRVEVDLGRRGRREQRLVRHAVQGREQIGLRFLVETRRKLVQQAADVLRGVDKQAGMLVTGGLTSLLVAADGADGMLQRPRDVGQRLETDRGRSTGQRMRQGFGVFVHRLVTFQRPFGQPGAQAARPFVSLVEEDVVELDADAQRTDDLGLFVGQRLGVGRGQFGDGLCRGLGLRLDLNRRGAFCRRLCGLQIERDVLEHGG